MKAYGGVMDTNDVLTNRHRDIKSTTDKSNTY
jgi:hypothetical protein